MNEFKKRQRLKKIIYSRAIVILLVVVALLVARGVWGIFWKYRASVSEERQLKTELADLSANEAYLASSTANLETQSGIEYQLQEEFGAVKPGEKEIVLVDTAPTSTSASKSQGLLGGFWDWLTNL